MSIYSSFSYWGGFAKHILTQSAKNAIPCPILKDHLLNRVFNVFKNKNTLFYFRENNQFLSLRKGGQDLAAHRFAEKFNRGEEQPIQQAIVLQKLKLYSQRVPQYIGLYLDTCPKFFQNFAPFSSFGSMSSLGGSAIVLQFSGAEFINAELAEELSSREKFLIEHEIRHILHGDSLHISVTKLALGILSSIPWVAGLFLPGSWLGYFSYAFLSSFVIESVGMALTTLYSQYIEKRADLEAVQQLGTNVGAIAVFGEDSDLQNQEIGREVVVDDYDHPPIFERLRYAQQGA